MSSLPETAEKRGVVVIRSGEKVDEANVRSRGKRLAFRRRITMHGPRKRNPPPHWLLAAASFCPSALTLDRLGWVASWPSSKLFIHESKAEALLDVQHLWKELCLICSFSGKSLLQIKQCPIMLATLNTACGRPAEKVPRRKPPQQSSRNKLSSIKQESLKLFLSSLRAAGVEVCTRSTSSGATW
ncbi:hypothetical protein BHM03_00016893 [Ensete ventricosum]|nr:hypothetical protein BHM03_00016893 [Ensete ventricosum]